MTINSATRHGRKLGAAVVALALSAFGLVGLSSVASADPIGDIGNIDSPDAGNGSIIITKYEKSPTNGTTGGNGTPQSGLGTTIDGVVFSIQEVIHDPANTSIDLLTNAGWNEANAVETAWSPAAPNTLIAGYKLTAATNQTTASGGIATFGSLHYGLYLIKEVSAPSNVTDPALPFLVTVPFPTGPSNVSNPNEWLYNVYVYPKNGVTGLTKVVDSSDSAFHTQGSFISWTITSNVPVLTNNAADFTVYDVTDTIDTTQLNFYTGVVPAGISPRGVVITNASNVDVSASFTPGTDYTYAINVGLDVQTLSFTATGRSKLGTLAEGGTIKFTVPTTVVAVPADGTVENQTDSYVNSGHLTYNTDTDLGQLRVYKYALVNGPGNSSPATKTPLAGATFQIYHDADSDGVADAGELVTSGGATTFTTLASGLVDIPALKPGAYLLVETVAPVGYQLNATPHPVTVVAGPSVTGSTNYIEVSNDQVPPWLLPFTGGNGVLMFSLLGGGMMALAFGLAFVAFRRRKAQAKA